MPSPAQHVADADAVVGRPEGSLREEDDRAAGDAAQSPKGLKGLALVEKRTPFVSPPMKSPDS
jgi:hypothetical protein